MFKVSSVFKRMTVLSTAFVLGLGLASVTSAITNAEPINTEPVLTPEYPYISTIGFPSPNGKYIISPEGYSSFAGVPQSLSSTPSADANYSPAFSNNGKHLYTISAGTGDNSGVKNWDLDSNQKVTGNVYLNSNDALKAYRKIIISDDDSAMILYTSTNNSSAAITIAMLDNNGDFISSNIISTLSTRPTYISFVPGSNNRVVLSYGTSLSLADITPSSINITKTITMPAAPSDFIFSPDGEHLAVANSTASSVSIVSVNSESNSLTITDTKAAGATNMVQYSGSSKVFYSSDGNYLFNSCNKTYYCVNASKVSNDGNSLTRIGVVSSDLNQILEYRILGSFINISDSKIGTIGGSSGVVIVYNINSDGSITLDRNPAYGSKFTLLSDDGSMVATTNTNTLFVYKADSSGKNYTEKSKVTVVTGTKTISSISSTPDHKTIYVQTNNTNGSDNNKILYSYTVDSNGILYPLSSINFKLAPRIGTVSPGGKWFAIDSQDAYGMKVFLSKIDPTGLLSVPTYTNNISNNALSVNIAFSSDDKNMYVISVMSSKVYLKAFSLDFTTGNATLEENIELSNYYAYPNVSVSPDGDFLIATVGNTTYSYAIESDGTLTNKGSLSTSFYSYSSVFLSPNLFVLTSNEGKYESHYVNINEDGTLTERTDTPLVNIGYGQATADFSKFFSLRGSTGSSLIMFNIAESENLTDYGSVEVNIWDSVDNTRVGGVDFDSYVKDQNGDWVLIESDGGVQGFRGINPAFMSIPTGPFIIDGEISEPHLINGNEIKVVVNSVPSNYLMPEQTDYFGTIDGDPAESIINIYLIPKESDDTSNHNNINNDIGEINVFVEPSITLTLNDDIVDLSDIPGSTNVAADDNEMSYTVTSNSLEGYIVTIKADQAFLNSSIVGNFDNIPVDLITVTQSDSENGVGSNATTLSSINEDQLYSQNQRSVESGDSFTSTFNLTEIPWVNADDYSGTVTYTATAN